MNKIKELEEIKIENMIYEIRGKQVMLDSDLARLYQCKNGTKVINQSVNRNIERFPDDFYFQLTKYEYSNLKSQIVTSSLNNNYGGVRKMPYVFTEQGVAMLATVLRTKIAADMSVKIMRAFVAMRHLIGKNEYRITNIETKVIEHDLEIKLLQEAFDKLDEKELSNKIYFNGQVFDAYSNILNIFKKAKDSLVIIDSYADNTILDIVKRLKINVVIITKKNSLLTKQDIEKYNKQYNNLKVLYNNTFHDRYFILDNELVYHCGASINRIGYKTFCINLISDYKVNRLLIDEVNKII